MIYCNFTKSRSSEEVIRALTTLWNSNPTWAVYDAANLDPLNPRFIRMDSEAAYTSEEFMYTLNLLRNEGTKSSLRPLGTNTLGVLQNVWSDW